MKRAAIIDYGMGNLDSVVRAVEECGGAPEVTDTREVIEHASCLILPGVGAFADGMRQLRERGLDVVLREQALERGIPLLGICLGMQLLATTGHEGGSTRGLNLVPGEVIRLEPDGPDVRIPHVGWNNVEWTGACPLADGIPSGKDFYFVHSYHFVCAEPAHAVAQTPYCGGFVSCVQRKNIFGAQFHPEKSQKVGQQFLRNFLSL
ncbi:MAG: imidazole glycerol phosphate synthase subunit HisH [Candidatus Hydrogenedentes bacterium]|nr:imidazole glycerol phosphate synthase subunit HisH [Candidatus Hydrogenedentota bacterium]